jgi:hypothetical protein
MDGKCELELRLSATTLSSEVRNPTNSVHTGFQGQVTEEPLIGRAQILGYLVLHAPTENARHGLSTPAITTLKSCLDLASL